MKNKGITLIALVITIIILLLLAGITITEITGIGLFNKARKVVNESKYANAAEKVAIAIDASYDSTGKINDEDLIENLNSIDGIYPPITDISYELEVIVDGYKFIISSSGKVTGDKTELGTLPENNKDIDAGTEVRPDENWNTQVVDYIKTTDGTEVKTLETVATVYAVSDGEDNTIPVPKGFYYVGGTKDTGVVISDDERDRNKFVNFKPKEEEEVKEGIPSGAIYNEDGTIKKENLTEEEQKEILYGNQFVWIPCTSDEYKKEVWKNGSTNLWSTVYETTTSGTELPQIQKYKGFYIGRYEAGTSNLILSTGINFENQNTGSGWANDNFSIRDGLNHTVSGNINIKPGEVPYYHAEYFTALKLSNRMYSNNFIQSVLVTGTMWDSMLRFLQYNDDSFEKSNSWGNYANGDINYIEGKGRYAGVGSTSGAMTSAFIKSDGNYHFGINTTAVSEDVKKKNLYDIAGNLWEWTEESAYTTNAHEMRIIRGGSFSNKASENYVCYRMGYPIIDTDTRFGFRVALYIK